MDNYIVANSRIIQRNQILKNKFIIVENGKIVAISENCDAWPSFPIIDGNNHYCAPALIEMHIHGCSTLGFEIPEGGILEKAAFFLAQQGVNTFVPTLQCDEATIARLANELESDRALQQKIPGLYIEGPFISTVKKGGIQVKHIRKPDTDYLQKLVDLSKGYIRLMTLAPELDSSKSVFHALSEYGIIPCFGHSNAELKDSLAFNPDSTVSMTHLFNGMSPVSHHTAGLAMLPFINRDIFFELNADCIHLNRESIAMSYNNCNHERLLLISDAVISAGLKRGEYTYYDKPVISGDRGVRYKDNDVLIGSNCLVREVVKRLIETTGATLHEAIAFATFNPAKLLGIDDRKGSIDIGKEADLIFLDDELEVVRNLTA